MNPVETGKKLRNLRGGKSPAVVAAALKISTSALAMYERGERTPRDEIKEAIARYYGRTVGEIFFAQVEHT